MKSDRQTIQKRRQEIYQMMCAGASSVDIVQHCSAIWEMTERNVYKLMKSALKRIREKNDKNIEELRFEACSRFDKLYAKLYKQEKYNEAAKVQAYKNKINGLEVQKIESTIKADKTILEVIADQLTKKNEVQKINK